MEAANGKGNANQANPPSGHTTMNMELNNSSNLGKTGRCQCSDISAYPVERKHKDSNT